MVNLISLAVAFNISNYQIENYYCQKEQVIRSWIKNQESQVLVVDEKLNTKIVNPKVLNCDIAEYNVLTEKIKNISLPGIEHSNSPGYYLSIDLCPSSKPYFSPELWGILEQGIPVAISITKNWAIAHPKEWQKLLLIQNNFHNITWINHSAHHRLITEEKYNANLVVDLLENEQWLIEQNQIPSIFFRLPGLLYTQNTKKFTDAIKLIPIGAGAWLSKGQNPKQGDIILIHGNGNDIQGIKLFQKLIRQNPKINFLPWTNLLSP